MCALAPKGLIINTDIHSSCFQTFSCLLFQLLAKNLGFKYELIEVPDKQYGEPKENGTWDGLIGEVISRVE